MDSQKPVGRSARSAVLPGSAYLGVRAVAAALLFFTNLFISPLLSAESDGTRVSALIVNRVNIFSESEAAASHAYRLLNRLHRTTREQTIARELRIAVGDRVSVTDLAAFERNLRQLNLFASVSAQLIEQGEAAGTLIINTRDLLSITAGADGSFVGGVGEVGVTVGERNLLGLGDSVSLRVRRNTNSEVRGILSYRDLHWRGADKTALYRVGATEEGRFVTLQFARPVKTASSGVGWNTTVESVEQEIDYYENGGSVAQIPEERLIVKGDRTWKRGSGSAFNKTGVSLSFGDYNYQPVLGRDAALYEQPLDNTQVTLRMILGRESQRRHQKVIGLDTLKFVQDVPLGRSAELAFGAKLERSPAGTATLRPVISGSYSDSYQLQESTYSKLTAGFASVIEDNNTATTASVGFKLFKQYTPDITLATRIDYHFADNASVLPVQYVLGESNGLRGYSNRLLSGDRMLRVNIEPRIAIPRKFGIFDLGLVGFFDAGWVTPETEKWKRSAGAGLRIGSNALLGRSVFRMDLAYPLDTENAEPVFSAAVGQMFYF